jgi:hypothetical protein
MENTTENNDLIEIITELTVSDIETLNFIVDTCLAAKMFAEQSMPVVETLSIKLKQLIADIKNTP